MVIGVVIAAISMLANVALAFFAYKQHQGRKDADERAKRAQAAQEHMAQELEGSRLAQEQLVSAEEKAARDARSQARQEGQDRRKQLKDAAQDRRKELSEQKRHNKKVQQEQKKQTALQEKEDRRRRRGK